MAWNARSSSNAVRQLTLFGAIVVEALLASLGLARITRCRVPGTISGSYSESCRNG